MFLLVGDYSALDPPLRPLDQIRSAPLKLTPRQTRGPLSPRHVYCGVAWLLVAELTSKDRSVSESFLW